MNAWPTKSNKTSLVCQVTIHYTHDGWGDAINTFVWLPATNWNGRLVGIGGGGFSTGNVDDLGFHVTNNFAAVTTDGGDDIQWGTSPDISWVMASDENLNWYNWVDFAYLSLDEAATLGKQVSGLYFNLRPDYPYWTVGSLWVVFTYCIKYSDCCSQGCSTGGRQGHVMAQRYPTIQRNLGNSSGLQLGQFFRY
ncbi:hypothetical protein AUP68_02393 [Ilyonectria robusta]